MAQTIEPLRGDDFVREYDRALRQFLQGGGEAALTRAYELGRQAANGGVGLLELALTHHEAVARLASHGDMARQALEMAAQFLAESLSPFEMTLRSYQANARLLGLSETLAQRNAEIDRAREQLRLILDATTAVIYLKDRGGRYLFVNRRFEEVFGVPRERVVGRSDDDVLPPVIAATLGADDARALDARVPQELEEILPAGDGSRTYLSLKFPLSDEQGVAYGVCCVATDVTERKRAEEAVLRAKEAAARQQQLEEAVAARDQFLSITSHELKTPLTSLELQIGILKRMAASPDTVDTAELHSRLQAKCDAIARHVDRVTALINNLIAVGRITTGQFTLTRERMDLVEVVRWVLHREREAIQHSRSRVVLSAPEAVEGTWDRVQLETAVTNLVSNAVKFGEGRPIDIGVTATADSAVLCVRDHGMGISRSDQERIFSRFERAVSSRHFGGFGIGLWLVRQAVEAHGGSIRVESRDREGATFTIQLPRSAATHTAAASWAPL